MKISKFTIYLTTCLITGLSAEESDMRVLASDSKIFLTSDSDKEVKPRISAWTWRCKKCETLNVHQADQCSKCGYSRSAGE